jgi:uncharacterized protein (TIGR02596 family)
MRSGKNLARSGARPALSGRSASQKAFSLVELLAVVSVILFMLGLSVPGFISMKTGMDLQNGALEVTNCLEVARQAARTMNCQAEIRLFTDGNGIRSMQVYVRRAQSSEWTPWTKAIVLPETVEISGNTTYSTLLTALSGPSVPDDKGREYRQFRFQADGSADFSGSGNRTLTVMAKRDSENLGLIGGELPSNYAVIQIDPEIGGIKVFQP